MNRMMTLAAVAAMGFGAVADPFEVRVWRGETTVVRILERDGAFGEELAALRKRYDYREAMSGKTDFRRLKLDTLKLVNRTAEERKRE